MRKIHDYSKLSVILIFVCFFNLLVCGQNTIVTWRGPLANGVFNESNLQDKWSENGPNLLWSDSTAGIGYTTPVILDEKLYSCGMIDSIGYLMCYTLNGKKLWQKPYGVEYTATQYKGARGNLKYDMGAFYYLTGIGQAVKIDAKTGDIIWRVDFEKELSAPSPKFGACEMPIIKGNEVAFTPGTTTSLVVLDKETGKIIRKSPARGDLPGYSSAILVNHNNRNIWFNHTKENLYAVDYVTADTLFSLKYPAKNTDNSNSPTYFSVTGELFLTQFSENGSTMLTLLPEGKSYKTKWNNLDFNVKIGGYIIHKGFIYGPSNAKKNWMCIDLETGQTKYAEKTMPIGCMVMADNLLYCYSEIGDVALVKPTPDKFEIISRFKAFTGNQQFTHPLIANGYLILRYQNKINVYDISKK